MRTDRPTDGWIGDAGNGEREGVEEREKKCKGEKKRRSLRPGRVPYECNSERVRAQYRWGGVK